MTDPDILAIQRKRRREKRCLKCGVSTPRAALCTTCRVDWRYCPRCEAVYPFAATSQKTNANGRTTAYCLPCSNVLRNGVRPTRAEYRAQVRRQRDRRIRQALKLYREGKSTKEMAAALGISTGSLSGLIAYARELGLWPARLRRRKENTKEP